MKKILLTAYFLLSLALAFAQQKADSTAHKKAGVSVELGFNFGFGGASNNSGNPEETNLSYESLTVSSGAADSISYKIGAGINASFELNLLFGKKRSVGLATGILYTAGFNSFTLHNFEVKYKATDREGRNFKRIVSASVWKEKVAYTNLAVPLLFKFRYTGKKKVAFFADIGPVVTVLSSAKSKVESTLDFEAVYAMGDEGPHYNAQPESSDWLITQEMIEKHRSNGGQYSSISNYFDQQYQQGYYVGLDKSKSGASTVHYKVGFGGLLRAGMIYQITPFIGIALSGQCLIVSSGRKTSTNNKPVDVADDFEKEGEVNSILNVTGSLLKAQYGINIGVNIKVAK